MSPVNWAGSVSHINGPYLKAGVQMKAVFWLVIMVLTQISRSRDLGRFENFWVIFRYIWR